MRDAVVIGAGHNGLVAANLLADAGWDVLVLEATDHLGGAVRSVEGVTAPGFHTDVCSAFYPLAAASPVLCGLGLEEYGLRWRHARHVLAHALPDGRAAVLSRDVAATAASLEEFASGDGAAWQRLYEQWQQIGPHVIGALFRPFPPVLPVLGLLRALGSAGDALRFTRFGVLPVRRFADELFAGEGGPLLLTGSALHTDLSPTSAGSAVFGWLLAMLGQDVGFPVPEGGAQQITNALVARLRARGGEVQHSRPVSRIVLHNGRAAGVRTSDGDLVGASRAVLADVNAPELYLRLLGPEQLPQRLVDDVRRRFQWDHSTVKVDWALSGPLPWTAPEVGQAGTVHLGGDMRGLAEYSGALAAGVPPAHPFLLLGQMTTADAGRSPAGTESVWAYTHVPFGLDWSPEQVEVQAERMREVVERHAPGFRDLIVGERVQGPGGMQEENPNLVDGAINGGTSSIHQELIFRPIPGLGRAETVVPGLYLAGSSAHPGGGVHGACGSNAAQAALAQFGTRTGPLRRRAIVGALRRLY